MTDLKMLFIKWNINVISLINVKNDVITNTNNVWIGKGRQIRIVDHLQSDSVGNMWSSKIKTRSRDLSLRK